ncbi:hypothetical protein GTCCBUS3UF5_23640 [Geobacillus thermoleovorans CCB_US3_UF5]|uniref:Uncharacterized protein n=1 Tax=Geobacillus thermoleovorans CCB_US3_UF5 TaxID=1111068 RepID=A0ABM5MIW0_GEOTH|nr:hypothetical protein GTCCBUS3UF5_23640 [Geobacillus thermoleovorans CCB_US3_UF5]
MSTGKYASNSKKIKKQQNKGCFQSVQNCFPYFCLGFDSDSLGDP